jgi:hypothetical protein
VGRPTLQGARTARGSRSPSTARGTRSLGTRGRPPFFFFCSDQIWRPALWFDWPTKDMGQTRSGGRARRAERLAIPRSSGSAGHQEAANLHGRAWERTRSLLLFFFAKIGSETDLSVLVELNSIDTGVLRGSDLRLKTCSNSFINLTRRNSRSMQTQIRSSRDNSNKLRSSTHQQAI